MLGLVDKKYSEALTEPELDGMNEMEMRKAVMTHNVFARASPQNKIQIVEALQAEKQISSMTGEYMWDAHGSVTFSGDRITYEISFPKIYHAFQ